MDVLPAGHEIGGYRIVRVAGRGAVGVVYEARHITLGKRVAIKTLNKAFAKEPEFRARFDREAQGAAAVDHPNITSVFDSGEQDGLPYLVMTYANGPDLERILQQREGPLEPAEAVMICSAVADALDAAAEEGLSHRDVKPANILLEAWDEPERKPRVFLTDFGLTKHNAAATVTRTGQFVGTLLYMAPEQIEGQAVPASDQYSLACVLWECIVGLPPFLPSGGSNLSLLTAHLSDPIPLISQVSERRFPAAMDQVFLRALQKKAADRYPSCKAFMAAASQALGLSSATAPSREPTRQPADRAGAARPAAEVAPGWGRASTSSGRSTTPPGWGPSTAGSSSGPSSRPAPPASASSSSGPSPGPSSGPSSGPAPDPRGTPAPWSQASGGAPGVAGRPAGGIPPGVPGGLPPGLAPSRYPGGSSSSSRAWLIAALVVVLAAVIVGIIVVLGS